MMKQQKGVSIVIVLVLLVVMSAAVMSLLETSGSQVGDSNALDKNIQALFAAEAAVEIATQRFRSGTVCSALARDPVSGYYQVDNMRFAIIDAVENIAPHCYVTAEAWVGDIKRSILVDIAITTGERGIFEPFPTQDEFDTYWIPAVIQPANNGGNSDWDSENCPISVCMFTLEPSGSLQATAVYPNDQGYVGYHRRRVNPPIDTGANGLDMTFSLGFMKAGRNGSGANFNMYVDFYDSIQGQVIRVWTDNSAPTWGGGGGSSGNWQRWEGLVSLPPNMQYDEVRLGFDLMPRIRTWRGNVVSGNDTFIYFDNVRIAVPLGAGSTTIFGWEEL
ncbi:MAG: hypothetical protein OEZ58_04740 [Gammaproteobacteria bacterium]|nr:hypothetical protein [Gammaproteobacteria bacterium]MDH5728272.1 hypothetical protein [Gammaproteobacteria bacterium]